MVHRDFHTYTGDEKRAALSALAKAAGDWSETVRKAFSDFLETVNWETTRPDETVELLNALRHEVRENADAATRADYLHGIRRMPGRADALPEIVHAAFLDDDLSVRSFAATVLVGVGLDIAKDPGKLQFLAEVLAATPLREGAEDAINEKLHFLLMLPSLWPMIRGARAEGRAQGLRNMPVLRPRHPKPTL